MNIIIGVTEWILIIVFSIWSFGCVLYFLDNRSYIFKTKNSLHRKINKYTNTITDFRATILSQDATIEEYKYQLKEAVKRKQLYDFWKQAFEFNMTQAKIDASAAADNASFAMQKYKENFIDEENNDG